MQAQLLEHVWHEYVGVLVLLVRIAGLVADRGRERKLRDAVEPLLRYFDRWSAWRRFLVLRLLCAGGRRVLPLRSVTRSVLWPHPALRVRLELGRLGLVLKEVVDDRLLAVLGHGLPRLLSLRLYKLALQLHLLNLVRVQRGPVLARRGHLLIHPTAARVVALVQLAPLHLDALLVQDRSGLTGLTYLGPPVSNLRLGGRCSVVCRHVCDWALV